MKKTQLLSVIALAFALGVVAPVTGVVSNVNDTYAYNTTTGTAEESDVDRAIAGVYANVDFQNYVTLQELNAKYSAGVAAGTIADLSLRGDGYSNDAIAIKTAINNSAIGGTGFGYNTTDVAAALSNTTNAAKQIPAMEAEATKSTLYNIYAGVFSVLANPSATQSDLETALTTFRTEARRILNNTTEFTDSDYDKLHPQEATLEAYRGASSPFTGLYGQTEAKAIYDAIVVANAKLAKYQAGYDLYMPFLQKSGLLTAAAQASLDDTIKADKIVQPSGLNNLAVNNIEQATELSALYTAWNNAKVRKTTKESGDNMSLIRALAVALKDVNGDERSVAVVAEELAKYKAPAPGDDDNKPGEDDNKPNVVPPTTDGDKNTTTDNKGQGSVGAGVGFGTPDTGVIAKSEGSASTSVAIMAAISTVVAGFGAAIVAIRNYRRNKNA